MKKIGILTLGCRVNQYESDAIAEKLVKKGYRISPFEKGCDAYIINTCTVTAESDSKCRKAIRRALRYKEENGAPVAVIGCFPQGVREGFEELSQVDYLSGNVSKGRVADFIEDILQGKRFSFKESLSGAGYEELTIDSRKYVKAYVKIEDGCNNFCSYCYVPFVRGRVRSRSEEDVIAEVKRLCDSGYREIILTGIETSAYGEDLSKKDALVSLVEGIQKECKVERLRFGSLNPTFFTEENLSRLSKTEGVMPHFHLSVQSGADAVLSQMGRKYTREELYDATRRIRKYFKNSNLSCDMICGFPGESQRDFEDSLAFIKDCEILHTHVFPYSKREGTRAAGMTCQIAEEIKHQRAREMADVAREMHKKVFSQSVGSDQKVLLEFFKDSYTLGYTENFLPLSIPRDAGHKKGDVISVRISEEMDRI